MKDCIFCKIANGEIPCKKVYEDENVIEIVVLKNSGNDNIRLELTGDGKIREV